MGRIGIILIAALLAAFTITDTPTKAEIHATDMGINIIWSDQITCAGVPADGCYRGKDHKIEIRSGMSADYTQFVIYHELGHVISDREGLNWSEADCDAYAEQMLG